jgi:hypothetical protein
MRGCGIHVKGEIPLEVKSLRGAGKSSFSVALMYTTRRRIPASAKTN